jgi:hypothetical protein
LNRRAVLGGLLAGGAAACLPRDARRATGHPVTWRPGQVVTLSLLPNGTEWRARAREFHLNDRAKFPGYYPSPSPLDGPVPLVLGENIDIGSHLLQSDTYVGDGVWSRRCYLICDIDEARPYLKVTGETRKNIEVSLDLTSEQEAEQEKRRWERRLHLFQARWSGEISSVRIARI